MEEYRAIVQILLSTHRDKTGNLALKWSFNPSEGSVATGADGSLQLPTDQGVTSLKFQFRKTRVIWKEKDGFEEEAHYVGFPKIDPHARAAAIKISEGDRKGGPPVDLSNSKDFSAISVVGEVEGAPGLYEGLKITCANRARKSFWYELCAVSPEGFVFTNDPRIKNGGG